MFAIFGTPSKFPRHMWYIGKRWVVQLAQPVSDVVCHNKSCTAIIIGAVLLLVGFSERFTVFRYQGSAGPLP